jgi:putative Ca2+/H+ antiporter (TMEM165/GDT1 family)
VHLSLGTKHASRVEGCILSLSKDAQFPVPPKCNYGPGQLDICGTSLYDSAAFAHMDWTALLLSFGLVFIAELGDKTQLAVVAQTCKYRSPLPVFLGGTLALTAVTALGAVGGRMLGGLVPQSAIRIVSALAFVVMGVLIWREATKPDAEACAADADEDESTRSPQSSRSRWNWKAFTSTLTLLFLAELGDKTQLAVLTLTTQQSSPQLVFLGGSLALAAVTGIGVIGGQQLTRLVPEQLLLRISAVAFVIMGTLMGFGVL